MAPASLMSASFCNAMMADGSIGLGGFQKKNTSKSKKKAGLGMPNLIKPSASIALQKLGDIKRMITDLEDSEGIGQILLGPVVVGARHWPVLPIL